MLVVVGVLVGVCAVRRRRGRGERSVSRRGEDDEGEDEDVLDGKEMGERGGKGEVVVVVGEEEEVTGVEGLAGRKGMSLPRRMW